MYTSRHDDENAMIDVHKAHKAQQGLVVIK